MVEGRAARGIGRGVVAEEALRALLEVARRAGVEAAEGAVPTALVATTTGHGPFLPTTAAGAGAFPIQPDKRLQTVAVASSPPLLTTVAGADGTRAAARPLPP